MRTHNNTIDLDRILKSWKLPDSGKVSGVEYERHERLPNLSDVAKEIDRIRDLNTKLIEMLKLAVEDLSEWCAEWQAGTNKGYIYISCRDRGEADRTQDLINKINNQISNDSI